MIPEIGHFVLILALLLALMQSIVPMMGAAQNNAAWMQTGKYSAAMIFALLTIAFAALIECYVTSDFSVMNVMQNSHTAKPWLYKIAGAWGNHEGSMLLWCWILALWGFLVACSGKNLSQAFHARVISVQGMIASGFLLFILLTSNPFWRLTPPASEGLGLNPVLQDPALAIHPPLLYTGYVGFSVAFCFAIAALIEQKIDRDWASALRPWVLAAWTALTAGITIGSFWAYYELGWGGFWFWDPVENASLMPWLAGTALLHSVAVLEKRGALGNWTVLLSLLAFSLSLLGTFLVRSGVLTSVHSFASDPLRGIFILALLALVTGGALLLYALRAPSMKSGAGFGLYSRETLLLLNNVFLFTFTVTVLVGTLYPIILSALNAGSISVGAPYFRATLLPLLLPFTFLMGIAPVAGWGEGNAKYILSRRAIAFLLTVATLLALPFSPLMLAGGFCTAWIVYCTLADLAGKLRSWHLQSLSFYSMTLAHLGFAVLIAGVTAVTQLGSEKILWMAPGDKVQVAESSITYLGSEMGLGKNYNIDRGIFMVGTAPDGYYMTPEKRWYPVAQTMTSETALHYSGFSMLYLVLGDSGEDGRRVVRIYHHPGLVLLFGGALMIAAGGLLSLAGTRRRRA